MNAKKAEQPQLIDELPDWLPHEQWGEFVKMRKTLKKPMTDYAQRLMIKRLDAMREQGQDVQAVLEQSLLRSWTDVYAVKEPMPSGTQVRVIPQPGDRRGTLPDRRTQETQDLKRANSEEAKRRLLRRADDDDNTFEMVPQ